jgi:hypothetical protein
MSTDRGTARIVRTTCDICRASGRAWLSLQRRTLVRCVQCGYGWIPEGLAVTAAGLSIYEDGARALFQEQADYYLDEGAMEAARDKLAWVRSQAAGGRLLDVGAGFGHFARAAAEYFGDVGIWPPRSKWERSTAAPVDTRGDSTRSRCST